MPFKITGVRNRNGQVSYIVQPPANVLLFPIEYNLVLYYSMFIKTTGKNRWSQFFVERPKIVNV